MDIIYSSAVLTESDRNSIIRCSIFTLTREYETFSCDRELVDKSLIFERVNDTIEGSEIHPWLSLLPDKILFKIGEGDTRAHTEDLYEAFALFCDTRVRHEDGRLVSSDW
jgi:hypothetical protein